MTTEIRRSPSGDVLAQSNGNFVEGVFTRIGSGVNVTDLTLPTQPTTWTNYPATTWSIPAGREVEITANAHVEDAGTDGVFTLVLQVETETAPGSGVFAWQTVRTIPGYSAFEGGQLVGVGRATLANQMRDVRCTVQCTSANPNLRTLNSESVGVEVLQLSPYAP